MKTGIKNFEQATETDNFNEEWEKCLFRVCYTNPRRRAKASAISEFISIFDEQFNEKEIISMIESALGQTAVTSVSSKENPNVRPPKGSYKPHFVSGYEAWKLNRIEKDDLSSKHPDFPSEESETIINGYINFLKSAPYNAVDFDPSKSMDEHDSDYVIKYAGGISVYYLKKKIGAINIHLKNKREYIYIETSAHPKHESAPLIFTKSGIEFDHKRKIRESTKYNKEIKGDGYRAEFKKAEFLASEKTISNEVLKFLIDESSEVKAVPEVAKEQVQVKKLICTLKPLSKKEKILMTIKRQLNS